MQLVKVVDEKEQSREKLSVLESMYQMHLLILLFTEFHVGLQVFFCALFLFLTLKTNCLQQPSDTQSETIC